MIEVTSILIGIMSIIITVASIEYYRQISKAKKEYEKAKNIIEDIVLSFNRGLKRQANKTEVIAYKLDGSLAKSDTSVKKVESIEKIVFPIEEQIKKINEKTSNFSSKTAIIEDRIQNFDETNQKLNNRIEKLEEDRIQNFDETNQKLNNRIEKLEEKITKLTELPETIKESVIPIRREKALGAITDTEITVLEILSLGGGKTAPEMKNRINLSREHTARLMKKLYEKGYLERETGKIPFRYNVKKEMEKFLNSTKNNQL
ncbi:MarR family transcriptional regulator [Candidatus Bathyarchaeota archaeon]|nr:MarR family transcriptional regulator [Candidatus Bathyarchaeota archaeon]